jgi:hypothetical protein
MDSKLEKICLHQLETNKYFMPREGVGDCRVCKPDRDNINCKAYYPINLYKGTIYGQYKK